MSETKHTPGPWRTALNSGYIYGPDVLIARVGDFSAKDMLPTSGERWRADARLLGSALNLAYALEAMLRAYAPNAAQTVSAEGEDALHPAVKSARAALIAAGIAP